jgi:hypothetical protein
MAAGDCHLTLCAWTGFQLSRTQFPTVPAGAIPLWKSAAGGGTKYLDMREPELQCCCSIRVDLAGH